MGNQTSQSGKVILVDGSIHEFEKPLTVAELMLEHPQQVVVELKGKPTPLPADYTLQLHKFYLMVPLRRGKPAHLSPQEAHNILLKANQVMRMKMKMKMTYANNLRELDIKEMDEVVYNREVDQHQGLREEEEEDDDDGLQRPDYLSRQFSSRGWKPKLDTIQEKKDEISSMIRKGPKVAVLAGKVVKRIESKGLVWG